MARRTIEERGNLRSVSAALGLYAKSKIQRVRAVTIKPSLTEDQRRQPMSFVSSFPTSFPMEQRSPSCSTEFTWTKSGYS